ncbi:unnamed protein product [Candidula unifasciata]|uniref:TIR domain-containing protein n=1 Tax=Candidula unifasciata TaxID=100452 RepID=A0A8S3ZKZ1_9EUPU|nr:unnamed protein product [Candidula unifasciata]
MTRKELQKIEEKSKSLIQRLCDTSPRSPRELCYNQGSSKCYCKGGLADCSGKLHVPNISYAPRFKPNIKCLILAHNNIRGLTDSFFANVSQFVAIDLSSNKLQTISSQTFRRFTDLKYLILNDNVLGLKNLYPVFNYPPSLRLDIVGLDLPALPVNYFDNCSVIHTSQIYMDSNYMPVLDLNVFAKLDKLEYLSVTFSNIGKVISAPLCNLKVLYLDNNTISAFPETCQNAININNSNFDSKSACANSEKRGYSFSDERTALFPRLTQLYLGHNEIVSLPQKDQFCLSKVVILNLQTNNISEISEGAFTSLRSLKALHLDRMNNGITKIGSSAFNIPALTSLYLSRNRIQFASKDVSTKMLQGCTKVHVLAIDHNSLNGMTDDMFEEFLNYTPSLKYIFMSSTEMQIIPVTAFSRLQKLEKLFIYVNAITEIPPGAFDNMLSLRYLYMDENHISTLKENAFSPETRLRLQAINLSKNPYLCDCDLLWFRSWALEAGPKQFMDFNYYLCSNMPNTSVQSYSLSKQACLFSRQAYILFTVCLSILFVFFLAFAVLYRYRWDIRLLMYERRASRRIATDAPGGFRYDLLWFTFVATIEYQMVYSTHNFSCLYQNKWRLQTCIHQRDFIAGGFIIDNIVEAMNASRRILVVVSSRFSQSNWCNFELQIIQSHIITHDLPSLLVIVLDNIEPRDMRAPMLALYNTTCCLEWPTETRGINTFWKRLEKSLVTVLDNRLHDTSVMVVDDRPLGSLRDAS